MKKFKLPPYPYDLLKPHSEIGERHTGGLVDLSVGTPCESPPQAVVKMLSNSKLKEATRSRLVQRNISTHVKLG